MESPSESTRLINELEVLLRKLGAFKVRVADPRKGFDKVWKGCHPRDVMDDCNSVIVFVLNVGLDYYTSVEYCENDISFRLLYLYRDYVELQLVKFLRKKGYNAMEMPNAYVDEKKKIAPLSYKLAAYEAGIGVFGRPGILITPEYGPRVNLGVVLTNARLEPDERMRGFNPCDQCDVCVRICPIRAIRKDLPPPTGFDRNKCVQFVDWIREKTQGRIMHCGYCFNFCSTGKVVKKILNIRRWKTLSNMRMLQRKQLTKKFEYAYEHDARRRTLDQIELKNI